MAMVGAMIGLSFAFSLVAAPLLYRAIGLSGIFVLTGLLAAAGIAIVWWLFPRPRPCPAVPRAPGPLQRPAAKSDGQSAGKSTGGSLRKVLDADMMRLNFGIFVLHLTQMTLFVVVPARLVNLVGLPLSEHWKIYLPVVVASFAVMMPPLNWAERPGQLRGLFLVAIGVQFISQLGFAFVPRRARLASSVLLLLFFLSFNMLEALMPSLVSRLAPAEGRGMAMGIFSTTQALGRLRRRRAWRLAGAAPGRCQRLHQRRVADRRLGAGCARRAALAGAPRRRGGWPRRRTAIRARTIAAPGTRR